MRVTSFDSPDGRESHFYPTQGLHESYNHFVNRVTGFRTVWDPPVQLVRPLIDRPSKNRAGNFAKHVGYASTAPINDARLDSVALARQRYHFDMRTNAAKEVRCQRHESEPASVIEPAEMRSHGQKTAVKAKKGIFQRVLAFFTQCFRCASTK